MTNCALKESLLTFKMSIIMIDLFHLGKVQHKTAEFGVKQ